MSDSAAPPHSRAQFLAVVFSARIAQPAMARHPEDSAGDTDQLVTTGIALDREITQSHWPRAQLCCNAGQADRDVLEERAGVPPDHS
jgi:hypothetical protein